MNMKAYETMMKAKKKLPAVVRKKFDSGFIINHCDKRMDDHNRTLSIILTDDCQTAFLLRFEQAERLKECMQ